MGVTFVIGRAGSGKTHRCYRAILEALRDDPLGPPIYWLLPRQATFIAERQLTCESGLGGFCRARVISFDELCSEILQECGGSAIPEVTRIGRQMILGHLLRKHASGLKLFSKVAHQPGLAAKLHATLCEFDACGRDPVELEKLISEIPPDAGADSFDAKFHDLALIYKAYCAFLGQDRLDPRRRMDQVMACISSSKRLRGATIYVDGFLELDEFHRRVLARLGQMAERMEITLLMDPASPIIGDPTALPAELGLFHRVEEMYRRLNLAFREEGVAVSDPVLLREQHRTSDAVLTEIERHLFSGKAKPPARSGESLQLIEAPDRRAEVEHAAREVRRLIGTGLRLRDIAVLVRGLDQYHDLLNAAFREHGLRFFIDRRRAMAHHPLLHFLRAVLALAQRPWAHESMMLLIKCGLAGLTLEEADRLENYVLEHRLRGRVWEAKEPWSWGAAPRLEEDESESNEGAPGTDVDESRRRVVDRLAPFLACFPNAQHQVPVRQIIASLFELLERFAIRASMAAWIEAARESQEHEQADEHEQIWAGFAGLLDQMVDLLGDEAVSIGDFQQILESGLESFDLALAPPTVDQVLIGEVERTHTPEVKVILLLGLNEGLFPRPPSSASVLSEPERQELRRRSIDVEPGGERRLLDENLLGYIAFTRASRKLVVMRHAADDRQRPMSPSPFWRRLRDLWPDAPLLKLPRDDRADPSLISTPRQLLSALMRWARDGRIDADPAMTALYQWLAEYPAGDDAIDRLRFRTWKALTYDNSARLSESTAKGVFGSPLDATVSQIETFATCPFRHFLRYGLHLRMRNDEGCESIDLNHALHSILERLVREMLRRNENWAMLSPEQAEELVRGYVAEISTTHRGELMLETARNRYLITRLERALRQVIASQQAAAQRGLFRTAGAGVGFGDDAKDLPPLIVRTPGGAELHIRGRIDRIDILRDQSAFAVLDYRLGARELSLSRVYHGLSLQLMTYLLVVQAHGKQLVGRELTPAAAFYVRLLRQLESVKHPAEAKDPSDPAFALGGKQRGVLDEAYFRQLDSNMESNSSDLVNVKINRDGTFGSRHQTDVADEAEFAALLKSVQRQLAQLGDRIVNGDIDLRPYRINTQTPCPSCEYRCVCRFDPAINHYRHIPTLRRDEILKRVLEEAADE